MGSCDKSIAKCVEVANLGEVIEEAVMIKKLSRLSLWPLTPQAILKDSSMKYQPLQSVRLDN